MSGRADKGVALFPLGEFDYAQAQEKFQQGGNFRRKFALGPLREGVQSWKLF
jgi:hypothetical protein